MAAESTPQVSVEETATPAVLRVSVLPPPPSSPTLLTALYRLRPVVVAALLLTPCNQNQSDDGNPDVSVSEKPSADAPPGPETNGDYNSTSAVDKTVSELQDDAVISAEVSVSGSDTEASRHDPSKPDGKGHSRTSSTKRPATFKSVSVNKTFLASKATSSTSAPKVGDKPTTPVPSAATLTSASSALKPRLVAKSAGLAAAKSSLSQSGRPAPNASAVWNKNQPVPVPDPKKFTDEELAKIGIHMASRLREDDTKGQSNWADIDEDDEDWDAPDAFTWSDGTKTTIPHVEDTPAIPEQPVINEPQAVTKPQSPAPQQLPASISPAVKPGLPSGKGLILKGGASSEKPTLVAKPPAPPTPVKSPWASLPAVPKVSPMEGVPEQPQRNFASPSQAYVRGGPPPPAREIAADDFSRSPRRDNQQLFNSQSGRYEPVPVSRGMPRADYPQRQPAVLQRPMHSEGPAEPSAAFQTTHTSGNYGRRRGSSNVSGGSGSFQRQPLPSELQEARRNSVFSENPISPGNYPPAGPQTVQSRSPYEARASPAMSTSAPQPIPEAEPNINAVPTIDNTVEYQKKLMQERRAEAIKRRQEQEAQEEAAKKERLAKKLAALGPPPERRGTKKEETQEAPMAEHDRSISGPDASRVQVQTANDAHPAKAAVNNTVANGVAVDAQTQEPSVSLGSLEQPVENKHGHPWVQPQLPPQPEPALWGSNIQGSRNVWGAPNNDRTLGNGSFMNAGFDAPPSQTAPARGGRPGPGPGPIGPPRGTAQPRPSASRQLGPIGPPRAPAQDARVQNRNKWTEQVLASDTAYYANASQRSAEMAQNLKASGLDYVDVQPQIKEQYTELDEGGKIVRREVATYGTSTKWPAPSVGRQDERLSVASTHSTGRNGTAAAVAAAAASHQSRFFPSSHSTQQLEPLAPDTGRPPEEETHPAFDGDARHPHVLLPPEKPLVKLPPTPSAPTASQRPSQPAIGRGQQPQRRGGDTTGNSDAWPAVVSGGTGSGAGAPMSAMGKLNALLQEIKQPQSVNSSSRTALATPATGSAATVSLPVVYDPAAIVDARSYVTKTMDEDCFEEQEMGSLPTVRIPTDIPEAAYDPAKAPPRQDRRLAQVVATSAEAVVFQSEPRNVVVVHLPDNERKTVSMAVKSPNPRSPNPRRGGGGGGGRSGSRYGGSGQRGGNRSLETSTAYVADQAQSSGSGPGSGRGRGRGYRGRGSDWSRAAAPVIQTQ